MKCTRTNLCVINLSGSVQLKNGSMILEQLAAWLGKEGVALPVGAGPSPAAGTAAGHTSVLSSSQSDTLRGL